MSAETNIFDVFQTVVDTIALTKEAEILLSTAHGSSEESNSAQKISEAVEGASTALIALHAIPSWRLPALRAAIQEHRNRFGDERPQASA